MTLVLTPSDVAYLKGKVGPAWLTRQIEAGVYRIAGQENKECVSNAGKNRD